MAVFYPFALIFLQILVVSLGFWGCMPTWLVKVDVNFQEDIIYMGIVYFIMMNYSSFIETLVLTPLAFSVPYYVQLLGQVKHKQFDPNTGEQAQLEDVDYYILDWLVAMHVLMGMGIVNKYCAQKDLAICVIDQVMVKRQ